MQVLRMFKDFIDFIGVTLISLTQTHASSKNFIDSDIWCNTYYGAINDIIELDYYGHFNLLMFKCDWFEGEEDKYWLICVYYFQQSFTYLVSPKVAMYISLLVYYNIS